MLLFLCVYRRRIAPTILLDVSWDSLIMNEEIFGPLLPIVTVGTKNSVSVIFFSQQKDFAIKCEIAFLN